MNFDFPVPFAGDVLFYTTDKPLLKVIEAKQRVKGFDRSELVHAALMVDGRVLVEARTKTGVGYVRIFESKEVFRAYRPAVILRHQDLARGGKSTSDLWGHSFYFYKQSYDWSGALRSTSVNNTKSICSTLVKSILSRTERFSKCFWELQHSQMYPAQLFEFLERIGFKKIPGYEDPKDNQFADRNDLGILQMLENGQQLNRLAAGWEHLNFIPNAHRKLMLSIANESLPGFRIFMMATNSACSGKSPLDETIGWMKNLDARLEAYHRRCKNGSLTWRDEISDRNNMSELQSKLTEQYNLTVKSISELTTTLSQHVPEYLRSQGESGIIREVIEAIFRLQILDIELGWSEIQKRLVLLVSDGSRLDRKWYQLGFNPSSYSIKDSSSFLLRIVEKDLQKLEIYKTNHLEEFNIILGVTTDMSRRIRKLAEEEVTESEKRLLDLRGDQTSDLL